MSRARDSASLVAPFGVGIHVSLGCIEDGRVFLPVTACVVNRSSLTRDARREEGS